MESLSTQKIIKASGNFAIAALAVMVLSCGPDKKDIPSEPAPVAPRKETALLQYSVVATYPHDVTAYTEGFLFHEGKLFESTGAPEHLSQTRSAIGITDLKTGNFLTRVELDKKKYFGEGIVILNNKLYQLTYRNQVGFIYDLKTFDSVGQFGYQNKEGWGMTTEGKNLIFSDGTCYLTFMDPNTFQVTKTLAVVEDGYGLYMLNELEYINGFIYANIWMTSRIVKIDPESGQVVAALNLSKEVDEISRRDKSLTELNGIAYDSIKDKILVTGKLWPTIYEISFPH